MLLKTFDFPVSHAAAFAYLEAVFQAITIV